LEYIVRKGYGAGGSGNGTPLLDDRFAPNLNTLPFARDLLGAPAHQCPHGPDNDWPNSDALRASEQRCNSGKQWAYVRSPLAATLQAIVVRKIATSCLPNS